MSKNQALNNVVAQEQKKSAVNLFRLANYYTPFGRIPDQTDFNAMAEHAKQVEKGETTVKELWPEASAQMVDNVTKMMEYHTQQSQAIDALIAAGAERVLNDTELFEHGRGQDRTYQRLSAQRNPTQDLQS